MTPSSLPPYELLFAATHGDGSRETAALRAGVRTGTLTRLHRGVYVRTDEWSPLDGRDRHVLLSRAVMSGLGGGCVVSHSSAAAALGLPRVLSEHPDLVSVIDPRRATTRRSTHLLRRPGQVRADDVEIIDGMAVTSLARTAVDVARVESFADAVLCVDAVLRQLVLPQGHRTGPAVMAALRDHRAGLLARLGPTSHPGGRAARRVIEFASPWAESGGESLLRVVLFELGLSQVELQRRFISTEGDVVGRCDAFLAASGTAVEFDGHVKLTDPRMLDGRTPAEVMRDRARRDQRLLACPEVRAVVHSDYLDLVEPVRLAGLLRPAGVRLDPRRVTAAARIAARRFTGSAR